MRNGSDHPEVVSGKTTTEDSMRILQFSITIEGKDLKLCYLIDGGFAPIISEMK